MEARFRTLEGVLDATSENMGGIPEPNCQLVCTGTTGHAEVVRVRFDPGLVSYERLLERFFEVHDPAALNRQGPGIGSQYRPVAFFHSPAQEIAARQTHRCSRQ